MKKNKREISAKRAIQNNIYAIRLCMRISKARVICTAVASFLDYFEWIFFSAFFIRYIISSIEGGSSFESILLFILIVGAIECADGIFYKLYDNYICPLTNVTIFRRLYKQLYMKAANVELSCYENKKFYDKYTMAMDGANDKIINVVSNAIGAFFGFFACIGVFLTMFDIDRVSVLFVVFPIIGNFIFGALMNKIYFGRYTDSVPTNRRIDYVKRVMHLSDYAKEIRLSRAMKLVRRDYDEAVGGLIDIVDKYKRKALWTFVWQCFFTFTVIFEGVLLYGAYRTMVDETMPLSDLAVLSSVMVTATWILIGFSNNLIECSKNGLFIENLRGFLEYEEKIPEDWDGIIPDGKIDTIEFRNVGFCYKADEPLISGLSFTIHGSESVALVGHNGAGKSTIIKLMLRLYDVTEGEILLNGVNIKKYNLRSYRALFGTAFQDHKVLAMSVADNVIMGRSFDNPEKTVTDALKKAGVLTKVQSLPNGIDTVLTKEFTDDGAVLSGGEYQKIVVARAFAAKSPIKIFDEPSSALDPIAECELFESILSNSTENKRGTMIFISHRLSSVKAASCVYMLENGAIIEQGTHGELMRLSGKYSEMYNMQAKNYLASDDSGEEVLV